MRWFTSLAVPMRTTPPKPPDDSGQRKPTTLAPKPARPNADTLTIDTLRKWRREASRVSGSGGVHGAGAVVAGVATAVDACRRSSAVDASCSRPVGGAGSAAAPERRASLSRLTVSRDREPTA